MKIRRWILLCLWILSLVAISFYGGTVSYGLFFGVTLLPVLSFVYLFLVYRCFTLHQKIESRNLVCGQPIPYYFVLQNESHFAFSGVSVRLFSSFSYVEKLPDDREYELLPKDKFTFETRLVCKYRGEYEVGVKEIIVTDFFRLFTLRYAVPSTIRALVQPKIVRIEELSSIADISALLQKEAFSMQTEPDVTLRDYMEGDTLKQIHWKATAKEQTLKVRNRIGEEKQGLSLFCDTKRYDQDNKKYLPLENKLLETLLALGFFFAEKNVAFSAFYSQGGIMKCPVNGIQEFENFYANVSNMVFDGKEEPAEVLEQAAVGGLFADSRVVFCVLHTLNDALMTLTEQLSTSGVIVVIYLVTEQNMEQFVKQSSLRRRIVVIPVDAELEGRL